MNYCAGHFDENSKSQAPNPKQIPITKIQMPKTKKQLKKINKMAIISLSFSVLVLGLFFGLKISQAAWQEPLSAPAANNIAAPISMDDLNEAKAGGLRIDPSGSLNMRDVDVKLDVVGEMKVSGTSMAVGGNLQADTSTLTVASNSVGIGTAADPNYKLTVAGGLVRVGSATSPIQGIGVYSNSSNNTGIQANVNVAGSAAVYGENTLNTGAGSYGVYGTSTGAGTGVYGYSASGTGVYAYSTTTNSNIPALNGENTQKAGSYWAGYFSGRLESTSEVVGSKFLPTKLQNSLVPYTTGWRVGSYAVGLHSDYMAFDGTYIWTANSGSGNVSKIRASDGQKVFDKSLPDTNPIPLGITFDGSYIWVSYRYGSGLGKIAKINPATGNIESSISLTYAPNRLIYTFDGTNSYIWGTASNNSIVYRIKVSGSTTTCTYSGANYPVGLAFDGTNVWVANELGNNIISLSFDSSCTPTVNKTVNVGSVPIDIIFDGTYLWVTRMIDSYQNNLVKVSLDGSYTYYSFPRDSGCDYGNCTYTNPYNLAFDGAYLWVTFEGHHMLKRVRAADGLVDPNDYGLPAIYNYTGIIFDGTYLWVGNGDDTYGKIEKIYSGTGWGHTDLSSLVSTTGTAQTGSFSTIGTATIDTDLIIGGDLTASGNTWGETTDQIVNVTSPGTASCITSGYFIKGVVIASDGTLQSILCRPL